MDGLARRQLQSQYEGYATTLCGEAVVCDTSGALFLCERDLLVVADLHLEKGAAFARRGSMLPPYDTMATLAFLENCLARYHPRTVICLGDSFHDRVGADQMPAPCFQKLTALMACRDWIWITGNHDPLPVPTRFGGRSMVETTIGPFTFRHEPEASRERGEIAGHLHPVAQVFGGGRSRRAACFATDRERMVLPAFGAMAGGLDVLHRAFDGLFDAADAKAYVIGLSRIYPIAFRTMAATRVGGVAEVSRHMRRVATR